MEKCILARYEYEYLMKTLIKIVYHASAERACLQDQIMTSGIHKNAETNRADLLILLRLLKKASKIFIFTYITLYRRKW